MMVLADKRFLTPGRAAREVGLTPARIRQLADAGALTATWTSLGRPATRASLEQFIAKRPEPVPGGR
jgi:hypothetical protein